MTGLFATPERFPKDGPVFEALGTLDELNSLLGICRIKSSDRGSELSLADSLRYVQECIFIAQAELAGANKSVTDQKVTNLETRIAQLENKVINPHGFVISGENEFSALLDYARAVARRAERRMITAGKTRELSAGTLKFFNRLSSFLYAAARYTAQSSGVKESSPVY